MPKKASFYSQIESLKNSYFKLKKGKESLLRTISEAELTEHIYNSNAIENSTLSLEETEKILLEIDLDRYISQRELFEAKNLARVINYLEKKNYQQKYSPETVLFLHQLLLSNIRDDIAGRFRAKDEWVRVGSHIAPDPQKVENLLSDMFAGYREDFGKNVVERISRQHLTFEFIHPFVDGNGRIGRVLINFLLAKENLPPINIKFKNRKTYYAAFEEFQTKSKSRTMESIIGLSLSESLHKRLAYLESKEIISLKDYAKKNKVSLPSLINKAKRQTIPAFTQKGKWQIGV